MIPNQSSLVLVTEPTKLYNIIKVPTKHNDKQQSYEATFNKPLNSGYTREQLVQLAQLSSTIRVHVGPIHTWWKFHKHVGQTGVVQDDQGTARYF